MAAVAAVAHLTRGGGNRVGAVVGYRRRCVAATGSRRSAACPRDDPPDRRGAARRRGHPRRSGRGTGAAAPPTASPRARRGDLGLPRPAVWGCLRWERPLRGLSARHDLIAIEVLDPRDLELPDMGTVVLADPETGRQKEVVTTPLLRREFAAAAAAHRDEVAATLRRCGAAQLTLRTDSDWVSDMVRFTVTRKRHWSGGGG